MKIQTNKKTKLANYLAEKKSITVEQALTKFGVKNLRAEVDRFRQNGWEIETVVGNKNAVRVKDQVTRYKVLSVA